jgi:hypothetical protein
MGMGRSKKMAKRYSGVCMMVLVTALVVGIFASTAGAVPPPGNPPSGSHYNLQLIGVPTGHEKDVDGTGSSGHRIFIKLFGITKILLTEGSPFAVLDYNGTDGEARFQLPANPCLDAANNIIDCPVNPESDFDWGCYTIWAAELGKPCNPSNDKCTATIKLCAQPGDCVAGFCEGTGTVCASNADCETPLCSLDPLELRRDTGKPKWRNVTRQLTTLCLDLNAPFNGNCDTRISLFDEDFEDFFWEVDNNGLRHVQLRFYPEPEGVCSI